ncbi:MAG TPA: hypothetical protein VF533_14345 [Solirubrobacteraceae bacterium]|jgi:hypothetical protein
MPGRYTRRIVLAAVLLGLGAGAPPASAGYAGPYTFESQSWWYDDRTTMDDGEASHAHSQISIPLFQRVSGVKTYTVTSKIHNEKPGTVLDEVRILSGYGGGTTLSQNLVDRRCDAADCTFTTTLKVNFGKVRWGLNDIRVHTQTKRVDTNETNYATSGYWVFNEGPTVAAGTSPDTLTRLRFPHLEGRGRWTPKPHATVAYNIARLSSMYPPFRRVCGTWRFRVRTDAVQTTTDQIASSRIALDPDLHHGIPGRTVAEVDGPMTGYVDLYTGGIPNGMHNLVIIGRTDVAAPNHPNGRLAGVLRVPIRIANNDPSYPCTPEPAVTMSWPSGAVVNGIPDAANDARLDSVVPPGTTRVAYLLDGAEIASSSGGPTFEVPTDMSKWTDGPHTLAARATTPSGVVDSPGVTFTVDNTP